MHPGALPLARAQTGQKPPVFCAAQEGLTSHFTRAGAYQEPYPRSKLRAHTMVAADQRAADARHLNYAVRYIVSVRETAGALSVATIMRESDM
uniref:Uncharacterized protein n=1 Tax=Knipowitschia caucasica TaxID=637954 RepID=A0AAV2LET8_KNICA